MSSSTMSRLTIVRLALIIPIALQSEKNFLSVGAWSTQHIGNSPWNRASYGVVGTSVRYSCATATTVRSRSSVVLGLAKGFDDSVSKKRQPLRRKNQFTDDQNENSIYSNPTLYDLAFGYRDFEEEVDFLLARHLDLTGKAAAGILEVAAGPARHAMVALNDDGDEDRSTSVRDVYCVDVSPQMAEYARAKAKNWFLDTTAVCHMHYQVDDMRDFQLLNGATVDSAWLLLGSLQHMTTNEDVIQCFQCIHKAVVPGGTLFLELPHPRETFSVVECTRNSWAIPLDSEGEDGNDYLFDDEDEDNEEATSETSSSSGSKLKIIWGDEGDIFDPITQVRQFTISTELIGDGPLSGELSNLLHHQVTRQVVPIRLFTAQEIDALARCAGWKVVAMYGALMEGVALDDEDTAFRLVCALQK